MFHFDLDLVVGHQEGYPMSFSSSSMQGTVNWLNRHPNGVEFNPYKNKYIFIKTLY